MAYATLAEARAQGATGTDAEVQAALDRASLVIDQITAAWWDSRTATVRAHVDRNGVARLPRRPITVTAVRVPGATTDLDASTYRVETADTLGGRNRILLGGTLGRWDPLRNHDPLRYGPDTEPQEVEVTGTFGSATTPAAITEATARLAASYAGGATTVNAEGDASLGTPPQVPSLDLADIPPLVLSLLDAYMPPKIRVS